jgi:hypothetical protein
VVVVIRGLTWKFDARKSQKFIFSLDFESDKNGQSKRTGYLQLSVMPNGTTNIIAQVPCIAPVAKVVVGSIPEVALGPLNFWPKGAILRCDFTRPTAIWGV